jgi:hypothetical protein
MTHSDGARIPAMIRFNPETATRASGVFAPRTSGVQKGRFLHPLLQRKRAADGRFQTQRPMWTFFSLWHEDCGTKAIFTTGVENASKHESM